MAIMAPGAIQLSYGSFMAPFSLHCKYKCALTTTLAPNVNPFYMYVYFSLLSFLLSLFPQRTWVKFVTEVMRE
jgi:hypothetical protein